jgi:hypothetical protein
MKRLTPEQRAEILARLAAREALDDIAASYNVSRTAISRLALIAAFDGQLVLS